MQIIVNAIPRDIEARALGEALMELGFQCPAVATALNGTFVPRTQHAATRLQPGDRLEVLSPMQGG
ncbi:MULTISPECIES: sulfur carrier protein ThiS [Roseobacteraceae]|uniref:sulfur carrier protein ThiS n=1 Tax=Roseobacteraceae TaxID=2854170 RepID=UPI0026296139|nr:MULTISPECIES: sulfur carrier protein ThiS [Roseobacteraceae]